MGMYTQIRGWLNIDSVGDYYGKRYEKLKNIFEKSKEKFKTDKILNDKNEEVERKWVCENTIMHHGSNGSVFLFIGTELKNYEDDAETWIKYILTYFPNIEGRIDFQYQEDKEQCKYWLIRNGEIIKEGYNDIWCQGYGNMAEYVE